MKRLRRCSWARDPLDIKHHDEEWGVPCHDDRALFEMFILEGAQAGLSWSTILSKRENYRRACAFFDPSAIARFTGEGCPPSACRSRYCSQPHQDRGPYRERARFSCHSAGVRTFDRYLWAFVGGRPIVNAPRSLQDLPADTALSRALSRTLIRRGFRFVGPKICYAFMQSVGLVNDHIIGCFRRGLNERSGVD